MKLIAQQFQRLRIVPENRQEAEILFMFSHGPIQMQYAGTAEWEGGYLELDFDLDKGREEIKRKEKEWGISSMLFNNVH